MLEEFARVLGHVMGLKALNRNSLAMEELRDSYKTYFGIDAELLENTFPEDLLEKLSPFQLKNEQLEALARALALEADLHTENPVATLDRRRKALLLYRHLENTDVATFSISRKAAIKELELLIE